MLNTINILKYVFKLKNNYFLIFWKFYRNLLNDIKLNLEILKQKFNLNLNFFKFEKSEC